MAASRLDVVTGGIRSKGRRGHTIVPNWRWEDRDLNPYELRIAGWLASHADQWREDYVSRNLVAARTGISRDATSKSVRRLVELGIIEVKAGGNGRFVITVDFDVWETPPGPSTIPTTHPQDGLLGLDQVDATRPPSGRHTTTDRTPGVHIEEQREQQGENPQTPAQGGGRKSRRRQPPEALTPLERADDFEAWWKTYPRKIGKLDAVAAWRVMLGHLPSLEQLVGASHEIEQRTRREHTDGEWQRFLPHPSTWLRRGDYLDFDVETQAVSVARHPCVLCGVAEPCVERCQGVAVGAIEDTVTECVWRKT